MNRVERARRNISDAKVLLDGSALTHLQELLREEDANPDQWYRIFHADQHIVAALKELAAADALLFSLDPEDPQ